MHMPDILFYFRIFTLFSFLVHVSLMEAFTLYRRE